ncbi:MAG: copper chaperone PCu(A)C [Gammaproteobacteria bacterium]
MHKRLFKPCLAFALCAFAACLCGSAQATAANTVSATNAWIRWLPGELPLAGYVNLHNDGAQARKLVGASSPDCKRIQLHHSMKMRDGMETMKPVAYVTVPAHGEFRFAPGDYHLMMWRKHAFKIGAKVPVLLQFADGARLRVLFTVKGAGQ